MVFGISLHRDKPSGQEDNQAMTSLANTQILTRPRESAQEAEDRQNKGIDYDMIYAEQAVVEINKLAHYTSLEYRNSVQYDEKGAVVYDAVPALDGLGQAIYQDLVYDANGTIAPMLRRVPVLVNQPKIVRELVEVPKSRLWAVAALVYVDTVMPTIWMGSFEADTAKMYIRVAFHDIRKQMNHDLSLSHEERKNCVLFLRAVRDLCIFRMEDTKEGRKPLLLKVRREELGVKMTRGTENFGRK